MDAYDCIVVGGGWGGMAFALLHAMRGKKVALFEAHQNLGGYGHCFELNSYQFCANMHYFFATQEYGSVSKFLKWVNLDKTINFKSLNKDGFDIIRIQDYHFKIPASLNQYQTKLLNEFPTQSKGIKKLFVIRELIDAFVQLYSSHTSILIIILKQPIVFINFTIYFFISAKDALNILNINGLLRAILLARCGNFGLMSDEIPFGLLLLEMTYYTNCASYPARGMKHFIDNIQEKLLMNNVHLFLNTEITHFQHSKKRIIAVRDKNNKEYRAHEFVSNVDPHYTLQLCKMAPPLKYKYQYTYSCFSLFLGLKNIKLEAYNLGNFNFWYFPNEALDKSLKTVLSHLKYENSFIFIATPSAHTFEGTIARANCHTMQIVLPANFQLIKNIFLKNKEAYQNLKLNLQELIIDIIAKKFIKDLREHIEVQEFWSPIDMAEKIKTPCGAMYGMRPNLRKILWPIGHDSPFTNLYFVGATATNPGLGPVLQGAMDLYEKLKMVNDTSQ